MRAFVTGAGSGFGLAITRTLLAAGHAVYATDVSVVGLSDTIGADGVDLSSLEVGSLDLRDPGLIASTAARAAAAGPIDVLVNNAGYAVFGDAHITDPDAVAALFDANVLGTARVTRALLGSLQASGGTVVQLSSVAGRMVFPESGYYAATKYALEAMSEALYIENCTFGMRVVLIEPGAFNTGFAARATDASPPRDATGPYREAMPTWDARKVEMLAAPQDPQQVADVVLGSLTSGPAFQRIPVGVDAQAILRARQALGDDAWVRFMGHRMGGPAEDTDVPTPAQVVAANDADLPWETLTALDRAGMLSWWVHEAQGQQALERIRNVPPT